MIFELMDSCFSDNMTDSADLISIARSVSSGRHRIYIPNDQGERYQTWLTDQSKGIRELWELAFSLSMESEAREPALRTVTVCNHQEVDYVGPQPVIRVSDAVSIATTPFRIFLENDDADRDFLLTYANAEQMEKLLSLERENYLSFEHSGGIGDLPGKAGKHVRRAPLNNSNCAAVFDSDAVQPGELSKNAARAENKCREQGVEAFMLHRRAIENYIAKDWLYTWVNRKGKNRGTYIKRFTAFCKLSGDQRNHFHMKNGLAADRERIDKGEILLYTSASEQDRLRLALGFGADVGSEIYSEDWVRNSQYTHDADAWQEVNGIVNRILVLCR